ncbi:MAG: hypothetical protein AB9M60_08025 [Leptothrix sp. (in: b-proteobacteria)]
MIDLKEHVMFTRLTHTARDLSHAENFTKLFLIALALPAVVLGTLAATATALIVVPTISTAMSLVAAVRTIGKLDQPLVLELPVSFTAGAASRFSV